MSTNQPSELLQISAIIAAGVVSKPTEDLSEPEMLAEKIVDIAVAIINEVKVQSH